MTKKIFFLIVIGLLLLSYISKKKVEKKQKDKEDAFKDNIKSNNIKGYETLDTGQYGVATFTKETYDYLRTAAITIAKDLIEVNNGHWDTWWAYEFVEKLAETEDPRKLWYLGYLIKKQMGLNGSLSERARRENWRMLSWTYLSKKDADRLAQLGHGFVEAMARVGH